MKVRSIQHPGVETREIDLSQYFPNTPAVNINNAYVMGFTDKGPIYDYSWLTSEDEFISIYGKPTNEAQRYLYYAVQSILANGGYPIVARMPYDNKQSKVYKGLTLTYGTQGSAVGVYNDVSSASKALIDLQEISNFIGDRIQEKGRKSYLFPRFVDFKNSEYVPKMYIFWQILSMIKAKISQVRYLSNASNYMKWLVMDSTFKALPENSAFVIYHDQLVKAFESLQYNNETFYALYFSIKSYFSTYAQDEMDNLFCFANIKYNSCFQYVENPYDKLTSAVISCYNNGITLDYFIDDISGRSQAQKTQQKELFESVSANFNKIFLATAPGYVEKKSGTYTTNVNTPDCLWNLNVRDLLINLCPTYSDVVELNNAPFYRGQIDDFMGYKIASVGTTSKTAWDTCAFQEGYLETNIGHITAYVEDLTNVVTETDHYTSYSRRFTLNGAEPSILGVYYKSIKQMLTNGVASGLSFTLDTLLKTFYAEVGSTAWIEFYTDEKSHFSDIAKIYNDPTFYKMSNECLASIDGLLMKQPEIGFKKMVGLVSKDVQLTNNQYDALVTTNNFEEQPDSQVYGEKINTANFCIVDKLKTVANGTQSNEGYFVTIIDPYDAIKLQRLLVNPYELLINIYEKQNIMYWGKNSELAWKGLFGTAIDTCDTLTRVKNADGIYVGQPGAGNKTNILDSWSVPLSAYYKNDSVSKILMGNFPQIPLNSNHEDGSTYIDKTYSSHIVVAVCKTAVNPSDGKIAVNVVETFFGSLFDEYDEATGQTIFIGNLINENSNYIEFYKNEYVQPGFGGAVSKEPYNRTTVNQFFVKDSNGLAAAAAIAGVKASDYDINEDFSPETNKFHFNSEPEFKSYIWNHAKDSEYPPAVGTYYWMAHTDTNTSKSTIYCNAFMEYQLTEEAGLVELGIKYANPAGDIIFSNNVTYDQSKGGNNGYYNIGITSKWKLSYGAFQQACRKQNVNIFDKKITCLYNLHQEALFTSFSQKECEKRIANTTGIYSPVYGQSTKVASNFIQDMEYCIKFIQNVDAIPIHFVADAGMSTIAQFCDNISWDSNNNSWVTQTYDPDNDMDIEDHQINSFNDCATWRRVVEKLDYISRVVRKDCMTIIDAPRQMTIDGKAPKIRASAWKNDFDELIGKKLRYISGINSSYTAGYLTWFRTTDKFTGKAFWLPPTCKLIGNLVYLNAVNLPWLAPAGVMYGRVSGIHAISLNPCASEQDQIYLKNWNYCKQYPNQGYVIEGQKTTLTKNSAFNRINVRTLFLDLERFVTTVGRQYRYKVNNQFTREQFVQTIKPKFEDYATRGGLYEYLIKCDDELNTAQVIDNNELRCAIYIKPARLIEFILIDLVCAKSGAVLSEISY